MYTHCFGPSTFDEHSELKWLENSTLIPVQDMSRHAISIAGLGLALDLGLITSTSDDKVCAANPSINNSAVVSSIQAKEHLNTSLENIKPFSHNHTNLSDNYQTRMCYSPSVGQCQTTSHSYDAMPAAHAATVPKPSPINVATNLLLSETSRQLSNTDFIAEPIHFTLEPLSNSEQPILNTSVNNRTNSETNHRNSGETKKYISLRGLNDTSLTVYQDKEDENNSSETADKKVASNSCGSEMLCKPKVIPMSLTADKSTSNLESLGHLCFSKLEQEDSTLSKFYKLECNKCPVKRLFKSYTLLHDHCRVEHGGDGEIVCCGQAMWQREDLLNHLMTHEHNFSCADCCQTFPSKTLWKRHLKQHHSAATSDELPYSCRHCSKKFSSKYGLANHLNLHLPEGQRPYKCRHCDKGFGAKHAMAKHERTHLPDEERLNYVCDICGKRFGYASTLDNHQKHVHKNERPFVCHVCAKSFPIKGALTYHLTTHQVQDRVQCSECGIWLKNDKVLRIHKKCHQGEVYACPHCEKVSTTRNNLRMHMKRHSSARPHPCLLCSRAFKTARDLKTHMVQHTGQKPYSCPFCPKTFASPSNFYAHRKVKHKVATEPNAVPLLSSALDFNTGVPFA